MRPQRSHLAGGLRIGAHFFSRAGALAARAPAPRGLVDRVSDLAHPRIDTSRVHPAVAQFLEDTEGLELFVRSTWRFPLSMFWRLVRPFFRLVGQFVLPLREARIRTRVSALDPAKDGRADARAVLRTYADTGEVMQVVAYATWERGGARFMSAAFPMPGGQILGVLRLDANGEDSDGRLAVALTSVRQGGDDAGVWFVLGPIALRSPLGERLELWPAGAPVAPSDVPAGDVPGTTLVGRHEQRIFGVRFVTHRYWFRPVRC